MLRTPSEMVPLGRGMTLLDLAQASSRFPPGWCGCWRYILSLHGNPHLPPRVSPLRPAFPCPAWGGILRAENESRGTSTLFRYPKRHHLQNPIHDISKIGAWGD